VAADELAGLLGGLRPRFDGCADGADVAADDGGDESAADADALEAPRRLACG